MKQIIIFFIAITTTLSFSQDKENKEHLAAKKATNYIYNGNKLVNDDYISAEMEYRKAISEQATSVAGTYNLGNSYYEKGHYGEALYRHQQAAKSATSKLDKHKAYHNMGNVLMQNKLCKEAAEAYKNALRNNPNDDETRYNYAIAKACAKQQQDQQKDNKDENEDENKEDEEKKEDKKDEGDKKEDEKDSEDKDEDGDEKEDEKGKPKEDKKDKEQGNEGDKKEQPKPQPKPGQLSPQQVKNLLEAMNNQEQKVQDKINAEKQKGVKIQTDKDW